MDVDRERAAEAAAAALRGRGIDADDAALTAEVLVSADARGKHSHGLLRLPRVVRGVEAGNVDPDGEIRVVRDGGATALLDGGSRLGPVVAAEAVGEAAARADDYGAGVVGARNSNHLGMLGYYTDLARREGYVAVAMTNTEPAMPPHGGAEAILGTNPIAIGIPTDPPFNLDMSTSSVSRGAVLRAKANGDELPTGVALDAEGRPTTDPEAALDGVIRPFGDAKGSGLAIAVEILAGGLVDAAMGREVTGTYHTTDPCTKGDLFAVVDPEALGGEGFAERASAFVADLKATEPAADGEGIRLPGERSAARDDRDAISVDEETWEAVADLAAVDGG
ncbi:Ldh family oxidoreductase [Halegenticoccus soli]|uniref:Ldh family oxidoreductase n=1 Tax=Halegenticoccus soli TaxID=1985678 RepID=UPI000C6E13FB|nr:Ldh family oxidoreductase [Halegenticoccus soli]